MSASPEAQVPSPSRGSAEREAVERGQLVEPSIGELGTTGERAAGDAHSTGWPRVGGDLRRYRAILAASGYTEVLIAAASVEDARAVAEEAKYELPYELVEHAVEDVFEEEGVEGEMGQFVDPSIGQLGRGEDSEEERSLQDDGGQMAFEFVRTGVGYGEPSSG